MSLVRNLRDGELMLEDGASSPLRLTILLDEGDLSWTERTRTLEIKDRGSLSSGHTRPGDEESLTLSFTARWTQLIGRTLSSSNPLQFYEFLTFTPGAGITSTSRAGEQQTLKLVFTVFDPAGGPAEKITFARVYRESLTLSEGETANTISFSGRDFETRPTITRDT